MNRVDVYAEAASPDVTRLSDGVLSDGVRCWVAHNRWDLVADRVDGVDGVDRVDQHPSVSTAVIVPYFEQPESLQRMYAALRTAALDPDLVELIVVDDGSTRPPPSPPGDIGIPTSILRQDDRGRRPGAARHLGASSTSAECLVFLDADTLPSPATVSRLARWCGLLPDALVVGSRRHVDLDGWTPERTARWLDGSGEAPQQRADPSWLCDAYAQSRDLLDHDDRSYRFVISGVMACGHGLYDDAGGFDVERDRYGNEDWDLATRCCNAGAVLLHDPKALAWHDEPDWSDRSAGDAEREIRSKNEQWVWLADRVADPAARGRAVVHATQSVICRLELDPPHRGNAVAEISAIESLLEAEPDLSVHLPSDAAEDTRQYVRHDPRVRIGDPAPDAMRRARAVVELRAPVEWTPDSLATLLARVTPGGVGRVEVRSGGAVVVTVSSTRAIHRVRRAARYGLTPSDAMRELFGAEVIDDHSLDLIDVRPELAPMFDRPRSRAS